MPWYLAAGETVILMSFCESFHFCWSCLFVILFSPGAIAFYKQRGGAAGCRQSRRRLLVPGGTLPSQLASRGFFHGRDRRGGTGTRAIRGD